MVDVVDSFLQGLDRPLVLYLIQKKPKHGYEIMTEIKRLTGRKLKPSTLYPLLYWLESKGYVAGEWVEKGQRNLRRYHLTAEGKLLLCKFSNLLNRPLKHVLDDLTNEQTPQSVGGP
jgi:DNA-binding PadR family transcriptional regulator